MSMLPWHKDLLHQVHRRFSDHRLHHALLLVGSEGAGSMQAAEAFVHLMLCQQPRRGIACGECPSCRLLASGSHPDRHWLVPENSIGVDQIRAAIAKLNETAHSGGAKVLVIPNAEKMTEASANALLKTLEEPTAHTYLILVTEFPQLLLPTIRSRCEHTALPIPTQRQSSEWLKSSGIDQVSDTVMALYQGAPLAIQTLMTSEERIQVDALVTDLDRVLRGTMLSIDFADAWANHEPLIHRLLLMRYRNSAEALSNSAFKALSELGVKLRVTGTNKSLALCRVLESLRIS